MKQTQGKQELVRNIGRFDNVVYYTNRMWFGQSCQKILAPLMTHIVVDKSTENASPHELDLLNCTSKFYFYFLFFI